MPYGRGTGNQMGIVALVLGIVGGVGGFLLYDFVTCVRQIGELCFETARPYELPGLIVMVFGGVLVVLGLVLLALPGREEASTEPPVETAPHDAAPPPPPGATKDGWSPKKTLAVVGVVVVIIVGGIVGGVALFQLLSQPSISIVESDFQRSFCFFGIPPQTYTATFTLVNNGNAAGFTNVQFLIDGTPRDNSNYFLHIGESAQKTLTAQINDCVDHSLDVRITSVWK